MKVLHFVAIFLTGCSSPYRYGEVSVPATPTLLGSISLLTQSDISDLTRSVKALEDGNYPIVSIKIFNQSKVEVKTRHPTDRTRGQIITMEKTKNGWSESTDIQRCFWIT